MAILPTVVGGGIPRKARPTEGLSDDIMMEKCGEGRGIAGLNVQKLAVVVGRKSDRNGMR